MLNKVQKLVLLDSIMENSRDIITVVNLEFNYRVCSRAFVKLVNRFHESEIIGKNIKNILPVEAYDTIIKNLEIVLDTREPVEYTFNIQNNSGLQILSQLSVPIVENSEITGILSVARDITTEENLKIKLMDKICDLNSVIEKKKQLESQKELFLTTLTHDLKNPVQAQIMTLKMLKDNYFGNLSDEQSDIINSMLESSNYMLNMLYSILKTYKFDNGVIALDKDYIDVNQLLISNLKEVKSFAESKNINIIYNPNTKNNKLYGDFTQLRRVIGNLINNAINYSYKNSDIIISTSICGQNMKFEFTNIGNPIENPDRIFEKYYASKQGTGLGLYFSKKVIEAHNGKIYIHTDGEKSSFIFEVPLTSKEDIESIIKW